MYDHKYVSQSVRSGERAQAIQCLLVVQSKAHGDADLKDFLDRYLYCWKIVLCSLGWLNGLNGMKMVSQLLHNNTQLSHNNICSVSLCIHCLLLNEKIY